MPIYEDKKRMNVDEDGLISVTVDVTDLSTSSAEALRTIVRRFGRPVAIKAFADFQQPGLNDLAIQFYQLGFSLVHCPSWPNGDGHLKTIVSDVMAQDLRDQLEDLEEVDTFLIVATSRDYIAVANALRRHDKRVVVIAEEAKVTRELRMCADEFVALPPARPERSSRFSDSSRAERVETRRAERVESPRMERSEASRMERAELPRVEKVELPKPEREEVTRPERTETPDATKLPTDAEVIAEVRRIVAAEGICTPRRLARALCPVDRTATGELRSRIANRIQSLIDSGKLQRDKLVVGGTSVETILVGDERATRPEAPVAPEAAAEPQPIAPPARSSRRRRKSEPATPATSKEPMALIQGDRLEPSDEDLKPAELEKNGGIHVRDLDTLVETVLMSPELASELLHKGVAPEAAPAREAGAVPESVSAVDPVADPTEPVAAAPEKPKRTRSRRKPAPKAATVEAPEAPQAE